MRCSSLTTSVNLVKCLHMRLTICIRCSVTPLILLTTAQHSFSSRMRHCRLLLNFRVDSQPSCGDHFLEVVNLWIWIQLILDSSMHTIWVTTARLMLCMFFTNYTVFSPHIAAHDYCVSVWVYAFHLACYACVIPITYSHCSCNKTRCRAAPRIQLFLSV